MEHHCLHFVQGGGNTMWYFNSPKIAFGENALSHLDSLSGRRAFIVTDNNMVRLGFVELVAGHLKKAGLEYALFDEVEPEPSLQTVRRGAAQIRVFEPDWIIGLGGGSCLDAAKAIWVLYERPDIEPDAINPFIELGLRQKARLITIPTTSGTGAEVTWAIVLTDLEEKRKLGLGSPETMADVAIVDPVFTRNLPPHITADTGMDALTHAIEGYTSAWNNDFSDGLCLWAARLIFEYLPRAYANGADEEARLHMHNAAAVAGLGFGNSMAALAHAAGHSLGAVFHVPHGRAVGLFLPYTIEFTVRGETPTRYADIARFLGLPAADEEEGAASLAKAIRDLAQRIGQPLSAAELGIEAAVYENAIPGLVERAEMDSQTVTSVRVPSSEEFARLFHYVYEGRNVDF